MFCLGGRLLGSVSDGLDGDGFSVDGDFGDEGVRGCSKS